MNRKLLTIACLAALSAEAQTAYKVDINEFSRNNMDEVLELDDTGRQGTCPRQTQHSERKEICKEIITNHKKIKQR